MISTGVIPTAKKVVIYGAEGIGKSTLASKFPNPVFIDTEGSTKALDVARFEDSSTWEKIRQNVAAIVHGNYDYKTIVIDTADWAERRCIEYTCAKNNQKSIESFGYGKGYTYLKEDFQQLLNDCDEAIARGINVVFVAHAVMRKFEQPDERGAYDRWELKLEKKDAPLLKEWCDLLLFCNYKTIVVDKKAHGGKRVMYTAHHPCWDAKNRYGLPEELPMDYEGIKHLFIDSPTDRTEPTPPSKSVPVELAQLMKRDKVTDYDIKRIASSKGWADISTPINQYPADLINTLVNQWNKVKELVALDINSDVVPY